MTSEMWASSSGERVITMIRSAHSKYYGEKMVYPNNGRNLWKDIYSFLK